MSRRTMYLTDDVRAALFAPAADRVQLDSAAWVGRNIQKLPARWQRRLAARWTEGSGADLRAANLAFGALMERLRAAPLALDATDGDVCEAADRCAATCERLVRYCRDVISAGAYPLVLERVVRERHVARPDCAAIGPAVARLCCRQWWRRQLRRQQARAVEGSAIALGYVSLRADRYVSDESLARRLQQNARNARTLERTIAENDAGQQFTLGELAARGPSNKVIRRGELITRIKGFEALGAAAKHVAEFATITCPSRMHAMTRTGERNPKHDGTTPDDAQRYLCRVWARIRAKLAREAVPIYGFRIAEPHGDGCPHWHLIVWLADECARAKFRAIVRHYALADSPDEPGAREHRTKFEAIDAAKGSAVGYVIKYVAKNIDGFRVGEWRIDGDLLGDGTLNLAPRIEAWAATWRIRQFQQIGGPPVGVWRELRRIPGPRCVEAPDTLRDAWLAAQKHTDERMRTDDGEPWVLARADWADYTRAAGGAVCRRADRPLALALDDEPRLSRYGDPGAPRPIGVGAWGRIVEQWRTFTVIGREILAPIEATVHALVESVRRVWRIVAGAGRAARSDAPRTRVNNCTDTGGPREREAPARGAHVAAPDPWRPIGHPNSARTPPRAAPVFP